MAFYQNPSESQHLIGGVNGPIFWFDWIFRRVGSRSSGICPDRNQARVTLRIASEVADLAEHGEPYRSS